MASKAGSTSMTPMGGRWLSPRESRLRTRRVLVTIAIALFVFIAASVLDHWAYFFFKSGDTARAEGRDWYRLLRVMGYLPTWLIVALSAWLLSRREAIAARVSMVLSILAGATLSGAAAELLKLVIARERPGPDGRYVFRGLFAGFSDGGNLGLPSSHAAVAFGGAIALALARPVLGPLAILLAVGCAWTRLLSGDHFLSDVTGAAMLAYAVTLPACRVLGLIPPKMPRFA
ncbi:MAG: phosphatase PAP2 family protein [Phycisphaerae bacterium]|nr:phosphatase PAP2 family protein [Phycisphaerae bacterium]